LNGVGTLLAVAIRMVCARDQVAQREKDHGASFLRITCANPVDQDFYFHCSAPTPQVDDVK
jgi:hypothetical protein